VLAKYADLTAALGTNGANIPEAIRKGGMSVKYVQTSDNKYVQWRLMSDSFNTDIVNWQNETDEATNEYLHKIDFSSLTKNIGSPSKNTPSVWTKDGRNRYHKVIPIYASIKKVEIKATANNVVNYIFTDNYNIDAAANSQVSTLFNNTTVSEISAGNKAIVDVPVGANYLIFTIASNSADRTPEYAFLIADNKYFVNSDSGVYKKNSYPITGNIINGAIEPLASTYCVSDFIKVKPGEAIYCEGVGGTGAYILAVYSGIDTSTFISSDSVKFGGTSVVTKAFYKNGTNTDKYVLVSTRYDSLSSSFYVIDRTSVVMSIYGQLSEVTEDVNTLRTTLELTVGTDINSTFDSSKLNSLAMHDGTLSGATPCTWTIDEHTRKHKVIEILGNPTHLRIRANKNNNSRLIFLKSYTEPTETGASMDYAVDSTIPVTVVVGTTTDLKIPINAKYLVFDAIHLEDIRTPDSLLFLKKYHQEEIDLSDYETSAGSLSSSNPCQWTVDSHNRYHKVIAIPKFAKNVSIVANSNNPARFILLDDYTAPTTNGEPVEDKAAGYSAATYISAGDYTTEIIPDGAKYLVVNVQSNGGILTPSTVVFIGQHIEEYTGSLTKISVVTCNPGDYVGTGYSRGSEALLRQYRIALSEGSPDLLLVQADTAYVDDNNTISDMEAVYSNYKFCKYYNYGAYNNMRILSNYVLQNERIVNYANLGSTYYHPFFFVADLIIDGRIVTIACVHIEWWDVTVRRKQIAQIIEYLSAYDSVIVAGDMNPSIRVEGEFPEGSSHDNNYTVYQEDNAIWAAAGYQIANGGKLDTFHTDLTYPQTNGQIAPWDNIYVRGGNIMSSKRLIADYMNDHAYVQADVAI
jgi:hypothetical protein